MRKLLFPVLCIASTVAIADDDLTAHASPAAQVEDQPPASTYISASSYIQNPYVGMPSGGGTQTVAESQLEVQNIAQKWFSDGTWNVIGEMSYVDQGGANNFGYAANIFAQTGQVAGFSFGGFLTVANPFLSSNMNPSDPQLQAQGLPINQQVTPQELFAEYQYSNLVQVDAGWIGINNSPWLTYYQNNALNLVTYQGVLVNVHPGGGWLLTGLAINAAQQLGQPGFSQQTLYNYNEFYNSGGIVDTGTQTSSGTTAIGVSWSTPSNNFNFRAWGYQFNNYANLAYADSTLKLNATKDLAFTIGVQGAVEGGNGSGTANNVISNAGLGDVSSNTVGLQLGLNYDIFSIQASYNNIWGPSSAYGSGQIVSPYTYQLATDPLYTTGWILGMVERSAGSAYKIAPSLSLLDNNLQIGPSYEYFATSGMPQSSEYDLQISYSVPQIKGFTIFGGYGYLLQPDEIGGNVINGQIMFSYLY